MTRSWDELSPGQQRAIVLGAVLETALKVAMLVDLWRRPAAQVRGRKGAWAAATVVNSLGLVPLAYALVGRRAARR